MDVITCLSLDHGGNYIMSGSRDTTSIIWDVYPAAAAGAWTESGGGGGAGSTGASGETPNPRPIQVLSGHDRAVSCVAISTELDMAVSGSGTLINASICLDRIAMSFENFFTFIRYIRGPVRVN